MRSFKRHRGNDWQMAVLYGGEHSVFDGVVFFMLKHIKVRFFR